jgi:hypothetical protein
VESRLVQLAPRSVLKATHTLYTTVLQSPSVTQFAVQPSILSLWPKIASHNGFLVLLFWAILSRRMVASRRVSSVHSLFDAIYLYQRWPPNNPPATSTLFLIAINLNPYKSVFGASALPYFCTPIFTYAVQGKSSLL